VLKKQQTHHTITKKCECILDFKREGRGNYGH